MIQWMVGDQVGVTSRPNDRGPLIGQIGVVVSISDSGNPTVYFGDGFPLRGKSGKRDTIWDDWEVIRPCRRKSINTQTQIVAEK